MTLKSILYVIYDIQKIIAKFKAVKFLSLFLNLNI